MALFGVAAAPFAPLEGWVFWVPLGGALGYALGVRRPGVDPGLLAWWVSLGGAALVGAVCLGHWGDPRGVLVGGFLLDSLGLPYVFLTVTLLPLVVLASLDSIRGGPLYYFWVLLLGGVLVLCFCVEDFLVFYLLFEVLGFPMFLLVGRYGPRPARVGAAYKFFVYTFGGAAFVLPVLVYLHFGVGSTGVLFLRGYQFTEYEQVLFFGLCAVPFGVKVPLVPLHLWLPEAHVEAPTPVSMLLAGLLLKTGGYAFARFVFPVFPHGGYVWGPALTGVALFSAVFAGGCALVQVDLKKTVAYASVAHMGVVFLGLLAGPEGTQGATYLMLAHGYASAGLFAGIGVLYDRYHTRTIRHYGGLAGGAPLLTGFFFFLTLGNVSFPFTGGFAGEFQILAAVATQNFAVALVAGATLFLGLAYSVWLFNRVFWGAPGPLRVGGDLTPPEFAVLGATSVATLVLGFGGGLHAGATQDCYAHTLGGQRWGGPRGRPAAVG